MPIQTTSIPGLLVVRWCEHEDERGFFRQTYQVSEISAALNRPVSFLQGNHSRSRARTLRGFHAELWDKFVYVPRGTALCAVADIRHGSKTFGRSEVFLLGDPPGQRIRLFISRGLCNAFYCHTEVDYINEVSQEFDPVNRTGVIWNDPDLAISWPDANPILSPSDASLPTLREFSARNAAAG